MFYTNMLSWDGTKNENCQANTHLVDDTGLQVHEDRPGDVFAGPGLGEESVEAVVRHTQRGVGRHQTVRVDPVLQAVQFPAVLVCQLQLTINGQFLST